MVGHVFFMADHAHCSQRPRHPLAHLILRQAHVQGAKGHILKDGRREKLVVRVLENETDFGPHSPDRSVTHAQTGHLQPVPVLRPSAERAVEMQKQGGFAGPIRPDDGHLLARSDGQVDVVQCLPPVGVGKGQVFDLDRVVGHQNPQAGSRSAVRPRAPMATSAATQASPTQVSRACHVRRVSVRASPAKPRDSIAA